MGGRRGGRGGDPRRIRAAQLFGVATGYISGTRRDLDRAGALAEIASITTDVEELSAVAALFVAGDDPAGHRDRLVELLVDAGADRAHIQARADAIAARPRWGLTSGGPMRA